MGDGNKDQRTKNGGAKSDEALSTMQKRDTCAQVVIGRTSQVGAEGDGWREEDRKGVVRQQRGRGTC